MVICPDCGEDVPKTKYCKNCGAYIEKIEEPVEVSDDSADGEDKIVVPVEARDDSADKGDLVVVPVEVTDDSTDNEEAQSEVLKNPSEVKNNVKYCSNCGFKLTGTFHYCPNCGKDLTSKSSSDNTSLVIKEEKNILIAIILSVFLPGLGQFYLGLDHKGVLFLIAYIVSAILILFLIGILFVFVIWVWALVDTIQSTNKLNNGEKVEDKLF